MHDLAAINIEQLATATDRLLLRGGLAKRRRTMGHVQRPPRARLQPEIGRVAVGKPSTLWIHVRHVALISSMFSVTAVIVSLF